MEQDWKPGALSAQAPVQATSPAGDAVKLNEEIAKQGDIVRSLKTGKAEKAKVDEAVKVLLDLKVKYKAATGQVTVNDLYALSMTYILINLTNSSLKLYRSGNLQRP